MELGLRHIEDLRDFRVLQRHLSFVASPDIGVNQIIQGAIVLYLIVVLSLLGKLAHLRLGSQRHEHGTGVRLDQHRIID